MRIHSIKLLTNQLEEAKKFYVDVLGLPLIESNTVSFSVKVGRSYLIFEQTINSDEEPFYHFAFDIPTNKIDEALNWLKSAGVTISLLTDDVYTVYSTSWNATSIYFYDSIGNIVEFIARHNLDHAIDTTFTSENIINISEIGLVVNDVTHSKNSLSTYFSEYKNNNSSFAPVGDEEGLFILCSYNRVWFGSNKEAKIFKTEITVESNYDEIIKLEQYPYNIYIKNSLN